MLTAFNSYLKFSLESIVQLDCTRYLSEYSESVKGFELQKYREMGFNPLKRNGRSILGADRSIT